MATFRGGLLPRRLTRMYAETKRSYENVIEPEKTPISSISSTLQRKLRIQKDRLITWGLDWSDANVMQPADIDDALDRAGLSDIVASVMSSIQELLDEAEQLRVSRPPRYPRKLSVEKRLEDNAHGTQSFDKVRFEDLLKDLTASIDTLFDLSRSRRGFTHPELSQGMPAKTPARLSAENRPALRVDELHELPSPEVKIVGWSSPPADQATKSSAPGKSEDPKEFGYVTEKPGTPTSLPPPYEAVTAYQASKVNLVTLLQLPADHTGATVPNLEHRLRLAFNLASNLNGLHILGLAYGKVKSDNVVFSRLGKPEQGDFYGSWRGYDVRNATFSPSNAPDMSMAGETSGVRSWSIFQHPRLGHASSLAQKQACDAYSLGLVLLEIGFWMPLNAFWKMKYTLETFKSRLENVYVKKLAAKCGSIYMRTVHHCLTLADRLFSTLPLSTVQASEVQHDFCSNIIKPLERCCTLDDPYIISSINITTLPSAETEPIKPPNPASTPDRAVKSEAKHRCPVKRKLRIWSIRPPRTVLSEWNTLLLPCLERIVNKTLRNPQESFSADLMMIGETSETSKPTIIITCTSVREIKTAIHRHLNYEKQVYDVKVRKGEVRRSKLSGPKRQRRPRRSGGCSDSNLSIDKQPATNPHYQQQPACGASIGAFRDNEHLPPVSLGGVILIDDEPYGMTVHHMLEQFSEGEDVCSGRDDEVPTWSSATPDPGLPLSDPIQSVYDQDLLQTQYPFEISDDDDDGYSSVADDDYDDDNGAWSLQQSDVNEGTSVDDDDISLGDSPGINPDDDDGSNYLVTQPAIDDVDDTFFPSEQDRDEEHLASHFLGNIHASSGIRRRTTRDGMKHEVDWALIRFSDQRVQHQNIVKGGRRYCAKGECNNIASEDLYPHRIAGLDELGGLKVHSLGRTSGLQGGTISPAMSLVKFQGRYTSSLSWHVVGNFGVGGDSGAWVIDNDHGRVCGHVLAWCSKNSIAYIAPMQVMLEDIAETLGAERITLPEPKTTRASDSAALPCREKYQTQEDGTRTNILASIEKPLPPLPLPALPTLPRTPESPPLSTDRANTGIISDLAESMDELQGVVGLGGAHFDLGLDLENFRIEEPSAKLFPDTTRLHDISTSYERGKGVLVGEQRMGDQVARC